MYPAFAVWRRHKRLLARVPARGTQPVPTRLRACMLVLPRRVHGPLLRRRETVSCYRRRCRPSRTRGRGGGAGHPVPWVAARAGTRGGSVGEYVAARTVFWRAMLARGKHAFVGQLTWAQEGIKSGLPVSVCMLVQGDKHGARRALSCSISQSGWPAGPLPDPGNIVPRSDSVLVPFRCGVAVYEVAKNGTARLQTVLSAADFIAAKGRCGI